MNILKACAERMPFIPSLDLDGLTGAENTAAVDGCVEVHVADDERGEN